MDTKDLHSIWNAPDNSLLTTKQYTVRLPIIVAAQLAALGEMYPRKTKTELIGDLLTAALTQLAQDLPRKNVGDRPLGVDEDGQDAWEQIGPGITFRKLTEKYLKELEIENLSNDEGTLPLRKTVKQTKKGINRKPNRS